MGELKVVQFAPGNLQAIWDGRAYRWFFAANQYDCIGDASGNRTIDSPSVGDIVDLFGWSTPATNFGISTSLNSGYSAAGNDYSGNFRDWGIAYGNSNGLPDWEWSTLSKDEWVYLLGPAIEDFDQDFPGHPHRTDAEDLCSIATVCGKLCLVIAPDGCSDFEKNKTTYSATEWAAAEANGIVCFAITCARYGNEVEYEDYATYWTLTSPNEYTAEYLAFSSDYPDPYFTQDNRFNGFSVRLVRECR